jgi:CheY-like chemotaxis protein
VSDTGTGMTPEVAGRAFEPFYTTKAEGQGTGLGLSQVFGFVKQSGGHVKIYSEPGQGTTVKIYLPRHLGAPQVDTPDGAAPLDVPRSQGETVLVVEDHEEVRNYAADALTHLGYRVVAAADASTAIALLAEDPAIVLLFTDVGLPGGMNGRQLADEAKRRRPGLRVLFTTAYARNAISHHGVLDHGVHLLPKPYTVETLGRKLRDVMHGAEPPAPPGPSGVSE